jgi:serine/threonine protein kinase
MPESRLEEPIFSCHTEFTANNNRFFLTYEESLAGGEKPKRALFKASMKSLSESAGKPVVVKFTRRYCTEAHRLLAGMSLAPKLLHHGEIAGIHFVVMEHLEVMKISGNPPKAKNGAKHIEALRRAVQALHDRKLVFGDLREPNIPITKDGLRLVDFDWSGEEGTVRYPADISEKIQWSEGVEREGEIKVEHDKEWFKHLTGTEL